MCAKVEFHLRAKIVSFVVPLLLFITYLHYIPDRDLMRLIDYLLFYVPLKNFSLIWSRHHRRWRAAKFKPMPFEYGFFFNTFIIFNQRKNAFYIQESVSFRGLCTQDLLQVFALDPLEASRQPPDPLPSTVPSPFWNSWIRHWYILYINLNLIH
jgi:hypothetical protein